MKNSLRLRHFCASGKKEKEKEKKTQNKPGTMALQ
jgi:hypothetical protein